MHPASGTGAAWVHQLDAFRSAEVRCITYDLRGWGKSHPDPDLQDAGCMSDDLLALVDHLGLDRFGLVAAAYGGFGGLDFALRFPDRLTDLVLSATQGAIEDRENTAIRERVVSGPIRALPVELRELGPSYRARDPDGVERWLAIKHASGEHGARRQRTCLQIAWPTLEAPRTLTLLIASGADLPAPPR